MAIIPSGDSPPPVAKKLCLSLAASLLSNVAAGRFKVLKTIGNAFQSVARKIERGSERRI